MMGVSRAAYYKWTHRKVTVHEQENQAIRDYIIELEEKNHYVFGVKRLMTYINAETQYHVSHGRVRRIMRLAGIRASIRVAKRDRQVERRRRFSSSISSTPSTWGTPSTQSLLT